jgi:hypothetical protein
MDSATIKTVVETIKGCAEIFALVAAALYFGYRFKTGYFVINLSLSVKPSRQRSPKDGVDFLVVLVKVKKGDRSSLNIHDARVKVRWEGDEKIIELIGADRRKSKVESLGAVQRKVINFQDRAEKHPFIRLTPGEETTFSCYVEVPSGIVCNIEVAVLGEKPSGQRTGQWRASVVSLPLLSR